MVVNHKTPKRVDHLRGQLQTIVPDVVNHQITLKLQCPACNVVYHKYMKRGHYQIVCHNLPSKIDSIQESELVGQIQGVTGDFKSWNITLHLNG